MQTTGILQECIKCVLCSYVPVCGHWPVDIMHYYTDVCVVNDTARCVDVESRNMFGRNDLNIF